MTYNMSYTLVSSDNISRMKVSFEQKEEHVVIWIRFAASRYHSVPY